tara:strand:+ start:2750 stop:3739 length:990 start_codon:yes stop_codon:yes gene_type:complete
MKYLVTGCCGFIGSHLTEKLLKNKKNYVIGIDNLSSGNIKNIKVFKKKKNFKFIKKDLNNKNLIKKLNKIDCVFHLAALSDIIPSVSDPKTYYKSNVEATLNLLEIMRTNTIKKIIYAASSSCYGLPKVYPTSENALIDTRYPYAFTKYIAEKTIMHWAEVYNLNAVSLRLFNVYGPRVRTVGHYGAVFGVFLAQLANNYPITIVGNGKQKRDFTYVSDVVNAFLLASKKKINKNEIINVGCGKPISINNLVKLIRPNKIKYIPKRPGEPDMTFASVKKANKILGWKPKISFKKGLNLMLKDLKTWKKAPLWTTAKIKIATKEWFKFVR